MPQRAQREDRYYYYGGEQTTATATVYYTQDRYRSQSCPKNLHQVKRKSAKSRKNNLIARILWFAVFTSIGVFALPVSFRNLTMQMIQKTPHKYLSLDHHKFVFPVNNYINNNLLFGEYVLSGAANAKKATMAELPSGEAMSDLEKQLIDIMPLYSEVQPSVYVWNYENGNYADINADEIYSAASIIKIPVLISLFKAIESKQSNLNDKMILKSYYRAEGSGGLQYKAENSVYTLDKLARIMITDSDNSSTNMIMSKTGSMTTVNNQIRGWGLEKTHLQTWLPDLDGTNHTTAKELAKMLYNIENPNFLSEESRIKIKDYMTHVKNNRLIAAGIGQGAEFIHKTGDIGKMLGDAGIVTMPNGKKYIVVIMVNRPYNSPEGKDFIVKASEIIYNYMSIK